MAAGIIPSYEERMALEDEVFNIQALVDVTENALRFYGEEVIQPKEFIAEIRNLGMASIKLGELASRLDEINGAAKKAGGLNED
jgi:hypothetical protein